MNMMKRIRQLSLLAAIVGALLIVRSLPVDSGIEVLTQWVAGKGIWGPMVYGLVYVAAALLFIPGSVLTLAAGAVFGLSVGTLVVSLSSTTAAALSFLIARHIARAKVEEKARGYPLFGAVDSAIGQAGWKMVALLRLSPLMPFSLGNYLYGLTAVPFWPYALASWVAMLPGTFMYVYFGHIGSLALAGGDSQGGTGKMIMTAVGLVATVAVTFYVSRLANRAIKQQTQSGVVEVKPPSRQEAEPAVGPGALSTVTMMAVAALLVAGGSWAHGHKTQLAGLFGPPRAELVELYAAQPTGAVFDHGDFDRLLNRNVDSAGFVDYPSFAAQVTELDGYLETLADADFEVLGRDEKLAFLINAYNAFTLRLIIDHYPVSSIRDIPSAERWDAVRWALAGRTVSLNQIEHEYIRSRFAEPRIHFALVCAAVGCPPLRSEAYSGAQLERQLAEQSRYLHSQPRWFRYEDGASEVGLTALYDWYGGDFEQVAGSVLDFAAQQSPVLEASMAAGRRPVISWLEYDWRLNSQENAAVGKVEGWYQRRERSKLGDTES